MRLVTRGLYDLNHADYVDFIGWKIKEMVGGDGPIAKRAKPACETKKVLAAFGDFEDYGGIKMVGGDGLEPPTLSV